MRFDAIIFDLDGTLLDTLDDIADAANAVLSRRGLPVHPTDAYKRFIGDGITMLIVRALSNETRSDALVAELDAEYREEYAKNWNVKTHAYDGVPAMLDALVERGVRRAILSNKPDDFTQRCVREFLGAYEFDTVAGGRDDVPRKPDPTMALEIAGSLALAPDRIMFVGDSGVDMKTAAAAGMYGVGVLWGFRDRAELTASGARRVIARPDEVLSLL